MMEPLTTVLKKRRVSNPPLQRIRWSRSFWVVWAPIHGAELPVVRLARAAFNEKSKPGGRRARPVSQTGCRCPVAYIRTGPQTIAALSAARFK
jgi:hypothetical protein